MPQTTVRNRMRKWSAEGQIATIQPNRVDGALENAYNGNPGILPFGRVSLLNPTTKRATTLAGAPAAGSLLIVPILTDKYGTPLATFSTRPALEFGYPASKTALVEYITEEDVVMWSEEAVTYGRQVHYRHTAGLGTVLGRVRQSADAATTATLGTCYFAESTTAAGLVAVTITTLVRV